MKCCCSVINKQAGKYFNPLLKLLLCFKQPIIAILKMVSHLKVFKTTESILLVHIKKTSSYCLVLSWIWISKSIFESRLSP